MRHTSAREEMKIQLGCEFISIDKVDKVQRVGHHIARIRYKTGKNVQVVCGVQVPSKVPSYVGSVEELIALINRLKD